MAFEDFTNWYKSTNWWRSGGAVASSAEIDRRAKAAGMKSAADWVSTGIVSAPFVQSFLKGHGMTGYEEQRTPAGLTPDDWKNMSMEDKQSTFATLRAAQQQYQQNPNALGAEQAEFVFNSLGNASRLTDTKGTDGPGAYAEYDAQFAKWQKENLPYQSLTSGMLAMTGNMLGNTPYKGDVVQQWFNNGKGLSWEDMAKSLTTEGVKAYALTTIANQALQGAGAAADNGSGTDTPIPSNTGGIGGLSGVDLLTLAALGGQFGGGGGTAPNVPGMPGMAPIPTVAGLAADPANLTALPDLSRKSLAARGRRGRAGTVLGGQTLGGGDVQKSSLLGA